MSDSEEERAVLLGGQAGRGHSSRRGRPIKRSVLWRLYISHFLSTWNMRSYEFTVILLFAAAYPNTLVPTSIRGVLTNGATLLLSPAVGAWVDRNAARFRTIRTTIVVQRACIVAACLLWVYLFAAVAPLGGGSSASASVPDADTAQAMLLTQKDLLVAGIIALSTAERVCAVGNQFVMERDWVPTLASAATRPPLHRLNAAMRRIDLLSKILAPVAVSVVRVRCSAAALAAATAALNLATVGVELAAARAAWRASAGELGRVRSGVVEAEEGEEEDKGIPRIVVSEVSGDEEGGDREGERMGENAEEVEEVDPTLAAARQVAREHREGGQEKGFALYFKSDACLASLSAALQSFSVLSLSGPMTTYLLTRGYSLALITAARTGTSAVEIGSTVVFPAAASLLARHPLPFSLGAIFCFLPAGGRRLLARDPMAALGLGGVSLQLVLLVPCFVALALLPPSSSSSSSSSPSPPPSSSTSSSDTPSSPSSPATTAPLLTTLVFLFLGLSRLGHWTHNMAAQQIAQTRVAPAARARFSGAETALVSAAETGRWACSALWGQPAAFVGVAGAGLASVGVCWALFYAWVWRTGAAARGRGTARAGAGVDVVVSRRAE